MGVADKTPVGFGDQAVAVGECFSVMVSVDGSVELDDGPVPTTYLRRNPELIQIAQSVMREGLQRLQFIWPLGMREPTLHVTVTISDEVGEQRVAQLRATAQAGLPHELTLRELDVLTLLVGGLSNNQIAERLIMSPRTVTTHVDRLLGKMDVTTRTAAATIALDDGLFRLPIPGGSRGFERLTIGRVAGAGRGSAPVPASRLVVRRPLIIGAALPLTGIAAADGLEMRHATELVVAETNARGGIAGRRVELLAVDVDLMSAPSVEQAFLRLAGEGVDVLTSGYLAHQHVAHEIAAQYGAPYLNAATLSSMVDQVANDPSRFERVFQVCPSDVHYGPGFVTFLSDLRDRGLWHPASASLLMLQGAWDSSNLGYQEMVRTAEQHGWDVEPLVHVEDTRVGWLSAVEHVRRTAPAAVMLGHYFVDGTVEFVRAFLKDPPQTLVYSLYAPSIPQFREQLGPSSEGLLWATVAGTYSDPLARSFAERYRAMHGINPGRSHAGIAYDRANIIVSAWSHVRNPRDHRLVADQIRSSVYRGVNGGYSFTTPGQSALSYPLQTPDPSIAQAQLVYQVQHGSQRIISPSPYADGTYLPPPWLVAPRGDSPGRRTRRST